MKIEKIVLDKMTENKWIEIHEFTIEIFSELCPYLPTPSLRIVKKDMGGLHDSKMSNHFIIRDDNGVVAKSRIDYMKNSPDLTDNELSWASVDIRVRKDRRREGLATFMLSDLLKNEILPRHKDIYIWAKIEPGRAFQQSLGGNIEREILSSHLLFDNIDWKKISEINKSAFEKSSDISVNITEGISEGIESEYLNLLADLTEELSKYMESWDFNRELFIAENKKWMKKRAELGFKSIVAWVKNPDGKLIGFSEVTQGEEFPGRVGTRMTGVSKEYRGMGLCLWMKTDLLFYLRENHPEITLMDTDNDGDNKAIRGINDQLGFVPEKPSVSYKYDVTELRKRLGL